MSKTGVVSTGAGFGRATFEGPGALILLGMRFRVGVLKELEFGLKGVLNAGRLFSVERDLGVMPNPIPSLGEASGEARGRTSRSCFAADSGVSSGRNGLT
jgi:hypothetical protein